MINKLSTMITEARRNKDLSMRELSQKVGCKVSELSDLEHGRGGIEGAPPLLDSLHKIVGELELDPVAFYEAQRQWIPEKEPNIKLPKQREEKTWNVFTCLTCDGEPEFSPSDFMDHCKDVHKIEKAEGMRTMVMHLDGQDFFQWEWNWDIGQGTVKAHQITRSLRGKGDPMRRC